MSDTKTTPVSFRYSRENLQLLKNLDKSVSLLCQRALDKEVSHYLLTEGCNLTPKEVIAKQRQLKDRLAALRDEYEKESGELYAELTRVTVLRAQAAADLDTDKIQLAQSLLEIRGEYHDGPAQTHGTHKDDEPVRKHLVEELLEEIAINNGAKLFTHYYGVKNYSYFGDQRSDHLYCYGPEHGSIVFSIGLKPEARSKKKFTWKQIDALIYFLEQMLRKRVVIEIPVQVTV